MKLKHLLLVPMLAANAATIRLAWDHPTPSTVKSYRIYERAGTNHTLVATIPSTGSISTTGQVENVTAGVHVYTVTAVNEWGDSGYSDPVTTSGTNGPPINVRIQVIVSVQ